MKAAIWTNYGPPDVLKIGELPKPEPKDDEILIKVHAASAMPGDCEMRRFDMHVLFWLPLRIYMGIFKPRLKVLGLELAGEVVELGKKVAKFKIGDEVHAGASLSMGLTLNTRR
ncbi:MAG: alcohol dehydrogenase catalytic domain-containing protein [Cyclobacteriaceae bacterium]